MILRYLSSASVGAVVTAGLFFIMQLLIESGEEVWQSSPPPVPAVIGTPKEQERQELTPPPDPPIRPEPVPPSPPSQRTSHNTIGIPVLPVNPAPKLPQTRDIARTLLDGPLVLVHAPRPIYPSKAIRGELEGTVTVRFDVNELGAVENVTVVRSSNSVFEKSAVAVTYRFKFKARVVDGEPQATAGLLRRFRFEMPD